MPRLRAGSALELDKVLHAQLIAYCRRSGMAQIFGNVLQGNQRVLDVTAALGFELEWTDGHVAALQSNALQNTLIESYHFPTTAHHPNG